MTAYAAIKVFMTMLLWNIKRCIPAMIVQNMAILSEKNSTHYNRRLFKLQASGADLFFSAE
jgi:hypothetical protein